MSFTPHIASTLYLPNSLWFLQKYIKLDQKSWKSAQTLCRVNPMAASFHAFCLLPQLNSDRSSRHNIFIGCNERNKVGVRDGSGAKRKRSTEIYELCCYTRMRARQYKVQQYRLCQKKLYNFQFLILEKVNKAQQKHNGGQNIISLCVRRFLNGIIPWSGVKVMVHRVISGNFKWATFAITMKAMVRAPLVKHTLTDLR